jgi:hypothetical protein
MFDAVALERAATLCVQAGFRRESLWVFTQTDRCCDSLAQRLHGRYAALGPNAVNAEALFQNPPAARWLETRLEGSMEGMKLDSAILPWLTLAEGVYAMHVRRDPLGRAMLSVAGKLQRMGVIDAQGQPKEGWPMEFCHRVARAAQLALTADGSEVA